MTARRFICVAVSLLLAGAGAAAQAPLETRGAWRLVADGDDFALLTPALAAPDSSFSLYCRKAKNIYAFEIKSPALAARPAGEDIRISFKVDGDDQTWFNLTTGPEGTVPISHLTPFWIIHAALTRRDAQRVEFTAAGGAWQFSLEGLKDLAERLTARCGFEPPRPGPERPRQPLPPDLLPPVPPPKQ